MVVAGEYLCTGTGLETRLESSITIIKCDCYFMIKSLSPLVNSQNGLSSDSPGDTEQPVSTVDT